MSNSTHVEEVGPQARIQAELVRLESHKKEFWLLITFAASVLCLGVLTLFFSVHFWGQGALHVDISPQLLFVIMVALVFAALAYVRRDLEVREVRLAGIQQYMNSQKDQAGGMIDGVTNVFTRSFIQDLLASEISRAERNNRCLALIMCHLNNFKQVNDRYGHLMGDYVLSQVATILKSSVRGSDYVVRYGGDEFLVVLPETDENGAATVRQRVLRRVLEWDYGNRVGDLPISVSLGVHMHVTGQTAEKDVAEADARMYAEEQARRRAAVGNPVEVSR